MLAPSPGAVPILRFAAALRRRATVATEVVVVTATAAKDVGWMLPIAKHKQFTVVKFRLFGYLQLNLMLCCRLQWIC